MLDTNERKSLRTIFDRTNPDNIADVLAVLLESYQERHQDGFTAIIKKAVLAANIIEQTTAIN